MDFLPFEMFDRVRERDDRKVFQKLFEDRDSDCLLFASTTSLLAADMVLLNT
jgi:hypothetical protein